MQKDGLRLYRCLFCGGNNVHINRVSLNDTRSRWITKCCDCGMGVTCIETVFYNTEDIVKDLLNEQPETD